MFNLSENIDVYNELPALTDDTGPTKYETRLLGDVAVSIRQERLQELVSVVFLHRHFEMDADSFLCWKPTHNAFTASVDQQGVTLFPVSWRIHRGFGLIPYEFYKGSTPAGFESQYLRSDEFHSRLDAVSSVLTRLDLQNRFGLSVLAKLMHRTLGADDTDGNDSRRLTETTVGRHLVVRYADREDSAITTHWASSDGGLKPIVDCVSCH